MAIISFCVHCSVRAVKCHNTVSIERENCEGKDARECGRAGCCQHAESVLSPGKPRGLPTCRSQRAGNIPSAALYTKTNFAVARSKEPRQAGIGLPRVGRNPTCCCIAHHERRNSRFEYHSASGSTTTTTTVVTVRRSQYGSASRAVSVRRWP